MSAGVPSRKRTSPGAMPVLVGRVEELAELVVVEAVEEDQAAQLGEVHQAVAR